MGLVVRAVGAWLAKRSRDRGLWLLVVLAYLPALSAAPGRMPADSKLYLYLDPQRLMSDGFHNLDPRQFAGWVPHQHIAYLWPSGPWFAVFEIIGVPDWIAHRLWIGTLVLCAGLGVRWVARLLGLDPVAALVAAVVYQCSPYLLPYVSRTSVMLLPWAGLGWIVGLTMLATLRSRWRHAAIAALVVFTVGAVNATALAMIAPAPVLWLIHAASAGTVTWRRAAGTAVRIGVLSIVVSLWWMAALVLQGRHGADVLAFSETLEATTFTSTGPEVLRGLGYWLFYVRDPFAATTTAAIDHLVSGRTVAIGLLVVLIGLVGLVAVRWRERRYALWLLGAGVFLGVGLHPFDDPAPLMAFLSGGGESGLALALRSSTRAVPMSVLAVALGAGALITALGDRSWRRAPWLTSIAPAAAVIVLAVAGLPAMWTGGFVDPALERDQDPPSAWRDAVAVLDARGAGHRVLQVPGAEFGAFRWGYTVDQPIPGMSDTPLVTRDLLPLGSPAIMDLLYALDDRFQQRILEPAAVAPIARLLGVDTVWLLNDQAFDRFRTPRPDVVADWFAGEVDGLGPWQGFGEATVNEPQVPIVDEEWIRRDGPPRPLPPVQLAEVTDAVAVVRAAAREIVVVGDGAGLVDAAAAGLLDPDVLVHQTLAIDDDELGPALARADRLVVTDTDRPRARHWRSSQDTLGMAEDGSERPPVLRPADGDARFSYGRAERAGDRTVAVQEGPITARSTAYGEPFAYRPERRPVMAIDGDPTTAWLVADRADPIGEALVLEVSEPIDHVTVRQPATEPGARRITALVVTVDSPDGALVLEVDLDDSSLPGGNAPEAAPDGAGIISAGQRIDLGPVPAGATVSLEVAATSSEPGHPGANAAVGFSSVTAGLGTSTLPPTLEVVVVPDRAVTAAPEGLPVSIVLTRERVGPTDRWRDDPEPLLRRSIALPREVSTELDITVRLDRRAGDEVLARLLGTGDATADRRLDGVVEAAGWMALDGRAETAWITPVGRAVGSRLVVDASGPLGQVSLVQPGSDWSSRITSVRVTDHASGRVVDSDVTRDVIGDVIGDGSAGTTGDASVLDLTGFGPGPVTIEITGIEPAVTVDRRYGEPTVLPAAIADLSGPGLPTVTPSQVIDTGCLDDLLIVAGQAVPVRVRAEVADLVAGRGVDAELCGRTAVTFPGGRALIETAPGHRHGLQIDRIVLHGPAGAIAPAAPRPEVEVIGSSRTRRTARVGPCPEGCWFVLGEGHNEAWQASVDGVPLPAPTLVDGGSNGWWLEPSAEVRTVDVRWGPQWVLTTALALTVLGLIGVIGLAVLDRRREPLPPVDRPDLRAGITGTLLGPRVPRRTVGIVGLGWIVATGLLVAPIWALAPVPIVIVAVMTRRLRVAGATGVVVMALGASTILWRVVRWRPFPDAAWVLDFADLHRPALVAVTALLVTAILLDPLPRREGPAVEVSSDPPAASPTGRDRPR